MKDADFWRTMYKEAEREVEYWKRWSAAFLLLLTGATLCILYLIYGRG